MPASIHLFRCLEDNYGVLVHDPETNATASIDAPEAMAVDKALREMGWYLTDILVTHHHSDHVQGIEALKNKYKCRVVGPRKEAKKIPAIDVVVRGDDFVQVGGMNGRVIDTPGHTAGHIAYYFRSEKTVFVGDTLFSIGCGRVLEGTMAQMWESLLKLRNLPIETQVYCGHEYTLANVHFAQTIEPGNSLLRSRSEEVTRLYDAKRPTLPTTIGAEKAANPFMRADLPSIADAVGLSGRAPAEVFAELRRRKDKF